MSELINNRENRRIILKRLIGQLHDGKTVEEVREEFARNFSDVSAAEISQIEQDLVMEGMPITEIQRLCDVHASVFKGSIEEIHQPTDPAEIPGHPVQVFHRENRHLERLMQKEIEPLLGQAGGQDPAALFGKLQAALEKLWEIDKHYSRKENLLFPYLERNGVTAPPKVMWGVDDEIRAMIKNARREVDSWQGRSDLPAPLRQMVTDACVKIREMIFKEEHILFPLSLEKLQLEEWGSIAAESDDIGFCLLQPNSVFAWQPRQNEATADSADQEKSGMGSSASDETPAAPVDGMLRLPSGLLRLDEMVHLLNTLPFDITFVDSEDTVRYFSQGTDRIFARTKAIIGRKVAHCHPPASVHIVETILDDFKSGARDHADFWIHMGPRYVLIRYFAVRNDAGVYLGTLEVTQDIAPIKAIEGDKRLLDPAQGS
jgi:hypothetical protein